MMAAVKKQLMRVVHFLLSVILLGLDVAYRSIPPLYRTIRLYVKLLCYGLAIGLAVAAGLALTSRLAVLTPLGDVEWRDVALIWGVALIVASVFGIGWLLARSVTMVGMNVVSRIADATARIPVPSETRWMATGRSGSQNPTSGSPQAPKSPRAPGGGDFQGYSEEEAYLNELRENLVSSGIGDADLEEALKNVARGAEV